MKHSDWSHTPYTTSWKRIQPMKWCSTCTSLLEFQGLLLEVVTFRLPPLEMVTSASSSPSPPLPEWGKHMARSPETFSELTFSLLFSVPLPTSCGVVARYSFENINWKELGLGPATMSRLILKLCSTVQQSRPIEADWADWDLFPFSSKLLYRYLSVHLSHLYKPISGLTTKTLTSTYTLLTQLHLVARIWPLIATLTFHRKFLLKSRALNTALHIMHWL